MQLRIKNMFNKESVFFLAWVLFFFSLSYSAHASFCHRSDETWMVDANTKKTGNWVFEITPGAMAPSSIPFSCFQRPIEFNADGTVTFPEPGRFSYNLEKCENDIGKASFFWKEEFSAEIEAWGVRVTAKSVKGAFSTFAETRCSEQDGQRKLVISPAIIDGKVGEIHYQWLAVE